MLVFLIGGGNLRTSIDDAILLNYSEFLEIHYINKPKKKL